MITIDLNQMNENDYVRAVVTALEFGNDAVQYDPILNILKLHYTFLRLFIRVAAKKRVTTITRF